MLGEIISPEQSKTKANDFVTRVANNKRRLHSSRRLSWSLRMGWQVVSTTIFEWLMNLRLKMWMNYRVVAADNLLIGRTNQVLKCLASLALGSWRDGNSRPGVPLVSKAEVKVTSVEKLKLKLKLWAVEKLKNQSSKSMRARDRKFSVKTRPQIFLAQNLIFFNGSTAFRFPRNPRKSSSTAFRFLQWLSDFFNAFLLSVTAF